jgi:antitoxin FitA
MGSLTIRNLDDSIKERLRIRAATHGHSMEEEVRLILSQAVGGASGSKLWTLSRQLFSSDDGVALELPAREIGRPAPDFSAS